MKNRLSVEETTPDAHETYVTLRRPEPKTLDPIETLCY